MVQESNSTAKPPRWCKGPAQNKDLIVSIPVRRDLDSDNHSISSRTSLWDWQTRTWEIGSERRNDAFSAWNMSVFIEYHWNHCVLVSRLLWTEMVPAAWTVRERPLPDVWVMCCPKVCPLRGLYFPGINYCGACVVTGYHRKHCVLM